MADDFIAQQDQKIQDRKQRFRETAEAFAEAANSSQPKDVQKRLLQAHYDAALEYFRRVDDDILERADLDVTDHEAWLTDRIKSSANVLDQIPRFYQNIRENRLRLKLPPTMFEPSIMMFGNMQSLLATERPELAKELRVKFQEYNLPGSGFEQRINTSVKAGPVEKGPWSTGSFYLFVAVVVLAAVGYFAQSLSVWAAVALIPLGIVLIITVAVLQHRHDGKISEKGLITVLKEIVKKRFSLPSGRKKGD